MKHVIGSESVKPCECGKLMIIEQRGFVLATNPPQVPTDWRCYGCGAKVPGPVLIERQIDPRERWERANKDLLHGEQSREGETK